MYLLDANVISESRKQSQANRGYSTFFSARFTGPRQKAHRFSRGMNSSGRFLLGDVAFMVSNDPQSQAMTTIQKPSIYVIEAPMGIGKTEVRVATRRCP